MTVVLVQRMFDVSLLVEGPTRRASVLVNFIILLTYPTNFFVYCAMSTQFRTTFRGMFSTVSCRRSDTAAAAASASVAATARSADAGQAMLMIQMNHTVTGSQL